jgi:hypothetical protein
MTSLHPRVPASNSPHFISTDLAMNRVYMRVMERFLRQDPTSDQSRPGQCPESPGENVC